MVRRLVEHEEVGSRRDDHGERQPAALAAREHRDLLLLGRVAREQELAEKVLGLGPRETRHGDGAVEHGAALVELDIVLGEVRGLDAVPEADHTRVGRAVADERLEQSRLARPVRPYESDVLSALDHELGAVEQPLASGRESQPVDLDDGPPRPGRLEKLEAERAASLREVLELPRRLLPLLLEPADLGELRLRLLGFRLLVAEPLDESVQPLDVRADPLHRLRRRLGARRALEAPPVPGAREVEAAPALELEHRGRHRLEEPAVVGDEHDGGIDRRQLALEPFEALDVEMVGRLVEQEQIGVAGERAAERGSGQLAARERRELAVEIVVAEPEAAEHRRRAVAPVPAAGMLEPRLRCAVAAHRRVVVDAARHRLLELAELLLDPDQIGSARQRVLAERQAAVARGPLIVECDPGALLQCDLAALDRRLADDRAQQCRLAGAVLPCERKPLPTVDRERDPVEQGIAGELLAQIGCDQDGHGSVG